MHKKMYAKIRTSLLEAAEKKEIVLTVHDLINLFKLSTDLHSAYSAAENKMNILSLNIMSFFTSNSN